MRRIQFPHIARYRCSNNSRLNSASSRTAQLAEHSGRVPPITDLINIKGRQALLPVPRESARRHVSEIRPPITHRGPAGMGQAWRAPHGLAGPHTVHVGCLMLGGVLRHRRRAALGRNSLHLPVTPRSESAAVSSRSAIPHRDKSGAHTAEMRSRLCTFQTTPHCDTMALLGLTLLSNRSVGPAGHAAASRLSKGM